ncbi:MAG: 4-(cytidine 5'-diphospho)-2-C-methyl-D-erythritol kinase [Eubacteriales bacterium]|nr:4-(cytidine 5'-diphospho)-2-C-methyl-D-erythritol kinase [Eubacteriales bacterium]
MRLYDDIVLNGERAIARSYAKINITLDVLGRRPNGYHDVKMIMQTTGLFDLLIVDKEPYGLSVTTNLKYLPPAEKNIAWKAASAFFEYCNIRGGAKMLIHKNVPVAAGLAGGSGNAAAVICALDKLYNTHLSDEDLCKIGAKLGADVPFCILGGTQLAEGIGEQLTELTPMPKTTVLLVKPPINISTAKIYEKIDSCEDLKHPDTDKVIKAINKGDIKTIAANLSNVMEAVTERENPIITKIKEMMMRDGAIGCVMSGSGPTVFGIFDDDAKAKTSADNFYNPYKEVYLTRTYN